MVAQTSLVPLLLQRFLQQSHLFARLHWEEVVVGRLRVGWKVKQDHAFPRGFQRIHEQPQQLIARLPDGINGWLLER
jgi:hypothetical protein